MTQIKTIIAQRPEDLDAAVNAALREDERWTRRREIHTHDHDGWLVAILVYAASEEGAGREQRGRGTTPWCGAVGGAMLPPTAIGRLKVVVRAVMTPS
jgi:hypothetical protein